MSVFFSLKPVAEAPGGRIRNEYRAIDVSVTLAVMAAAGFFDRYDFATANVGDFITCFASDGAGLYEITGDDGSGGKVLTLRVSYGSGGGGGATTFVALTDTPASLGSAGQVPAVNAGGTALEWTTPSGGGGATTFVGLTDTPASMGAAGQVPAVNAGGTALEWTTPSGGGGSTTFLGLTDTPANFTDQKRKRVLVNQAESALEFEDLIKPQWVGRP